MKVILTEKITKLGNIGDTVNVATGHARNYLIPNGKAMRWSRDNLAAFESKKADLIAKHESARAAAEAAAPRVAAAKLHIIRSAGDTGHLYGSVSSRDIARLVRELSGVEILSEQVSLGQPIKEIGTWNLRIILHPDVIVEVKAYVAQTQDEIEALVAGKSIKRDTGKKIAADAEFADDAVTTQPPAETPAETQPAEQSPEKSE